MFFCLSGFQCFPGVPFLQRRGAGTNDIYNLRDVETEMEIADGTYIQERTTQHYNHVIRTELGYDKFDFHCLRHTHATELCEEGVNIKEIQRRLGHSTMEVTSKRYLHATERMEDESIELMNAKFTKRPPVNPNPGQQVSGT